MQYDMHFDVFSLHLVYLSIAACISENETK